MYVNIDLLNDISNKEWRGLKIQFTNILMLVQIENRFIIAVAIGLSHKWRISKLLQI